MKSKNIYNKETTILFHKIEWYSSFEEYELERLDESDEEHIIYMLNNGYREGELCTTRINLSGQHITYYGGWRIAC